jgi:phosphoglycerate dehydrogenase-like enzyme
MIVYLTEPNEIANEAKRLLIDNGFSLITDSILHTVNKNDIRVLFIRSYTKVDKALLDSMPGLTFILRAGVGVDTIDVEECGKRNIRILNAPGSNANAVAEYVIGLMIMLMRNALFQMRQIHESKWRVRARTGHEIKGKVIGIIGCGAIGQSIAHKLQPFSPALILGYDPHVAAETLTGKQIQKAEISEILSRGDIITLHLPLLKDTMNLIGEKELHSMKQTAYLINTSRGGIVDEAALIHALKTGVIAGAALDVFTTEPEINPELKNLDNIILSPHIAGFTEEADIAMAVAPVQELLRSMNE